MNPMLARIPRTLLQLFFLGVVVSLALSLDYVYATHGGWHGPTAAPPGNNVAAPLNVGNALQGKGGGLTIGSTLDVVASTTMSGGLGFRTRGSALTNPAFTIDMGPLPEGANYGIRFADGSVQLTAYEPSVAKGPVTIDFECWNSDDNDGCKSTVSCPVGMTIKSSKLAMNLEYGFVGSGQLGQVAQNTMTVLAPSSNVGDGEAEVWLSMSEEENPRISSGSVDISGVIGKSKLRYSCKENDSNGGDCHALGQMVCN